MDKADIVGVLEEIAVLLELKGENPFKIRAYASGARALETMDADLAVLIAEGQLGSMKGIGSALVDKIETLHASGELPFYDKLKASIAPGLIEMLEIPGLGGEEGEAIARRSGGGECCGFESGLRGRSRGWLAGLRGEVGGKDFEWY